MYKLLISIIIMTSLVAITLLNPFRQKINVKNITIENKNKKISKLDAVLLPYLDKIEVDKNLISAISKPAKTLKIKRLWIDKTAVKQGDFYKFVAWSKVHNMVKFLAKTQNKNWRFYSSSKNHGLSGKLEVASNGISFFDSFSYCLANSGRLPTNDEFSVIAGENLYPWGNTFNAKPWTYHDPRLNSTIKPGSFVSTNTKDGIMDIGSLLSEWTMGDYPQNLPSIRGGNAYLKPYQLYSLNVFYQKLEPNYRSPYIGFRCVYDKKPQIKTPWKTKINVVYLQNKKIKINDYPNSKIKSMLKFLPKIGKEKFKQLLTITKKIKYSLAVAINEVKVEQYAQFLDSILVKTNIYSHPQQPKKHNLIPLNWQKQKQFPQRAVTGIDFWSAYHFANWAGGRLPTYDEMIKIYALSENKNSIFKENKQMHSIQLKPSFKIENLTGNIAEWTTSINTNYEDLRMIVYGGSFLISKKRAQNINFYRSINPNVRLLDVGLRLVFD